MPYPDYRGDSFWNMMQVENLRQLISSRIGVQVRDQDLPRFRDTLIVRYSLLQMAGFQEYSELLQGKTSESDREWEQLATLLTTGETFFFRDEGQIELLRKHIIPGLIDHRREAKSLRIWSAGCSTGEEPYSIAMLLDELIGTRNDWKIFILATDIDSAALQKARRGVFTPWSFRKVAREVQQKYFREHGRDWEIDSRLKNNVAFQTLNLLADDFPNEVAGEMDLIICRNVFIYFDHNHVESIVKKFAVTLRGGGYLLTGHGELQGDIGELLKRRDFSRSIAYQRIDAKYKEATPSTQFVSFNPSDPVPQRPPSPVESRVNQRAPVEPAKQQESLPGSFDDACDEIDELRRQGEHSVALEKAEQLAMEHPGNARAHCLVAQSHADLGDHQRAIESLKHATAIDSFATTPQYLLAHIAEAEGRYEDASAYLKKVIYLDPSHIAAQLEMAEIRERDGDSSQARKLRLAVIDLLRAMPDDEPVEFHGQSANQLAEQLQRKITHG